MDERNKTSGPWHKDGIVHADAGRQLSGEAIWKNFHRFFLGDGETEVPHPVLLIAWLVLSLSRVYPCFFSLWEDEIWPLVVAVDASWTTALGFGHYWEGHHILHVVVSKILIKATGHHAVEFVYRTPSLIASILVIPLAWAVFRRAAGTAVASAGSILLSFLPSFVYHSANARGYMIWALCTVWVWGLSPGLHSRIHWVRLSFASFFLGLSHGLGLFTLGVFVAFGSMTGPQRHRLRTLLLGGVLMTPAFLYSLPIIPVVFAFERTMAHIGSGRNVPAFLFLPRLAESLFGTPIFPGLGIAWALLVLSGAALYLVRLRMRGLGLVAVALAIPAGFVLKANPFSEERFFFGVVPIWIFFGVLAVACAVGTMPLTVRRKQIVIVAASLVLALPWLPRTHANTVTQKQDYAGAYRRITSAHLRTPRLFGVSPSYATGLSYYSRRSGVPYQVLTSIGEARDTLARLGEAMFVVVPTPAEIPDSMMHWVGDDLVPDTVLRGVQLPTVLYRGRFLKRSSDGG